MGLLSTSDIADAKTSWAEVIGDNSVSIVIRRGSSELPAQTVRVELAGAMNSRLSNPQASEQTEQSATVMGTESLDIQKGDRFNAHGYRFEVTAVQPNIQFGRLAEAVLTE